MAYKKGPCQRHLDLQARCGAELPVALPPRAALPSHDVFPLPFLELHYVSSRKQPLPSYKHSPGLLTSGPATPQPLSVHPSHLAVTLATYLLDRSGSRDGRGRRGGRGGVTYTEHNSSLLTNSLETLGLHNEKAFPRVSRALLEGQTKVRARTRLLLSPPSARAGARTWGRTWASGGGTTGARWEGCLEKGAWAQAALGCGTEHTHHGWAQGTCLERGWRGVLAARQASVLPVGQGMAGGVAFCHPGKGGMKKGRTTLAP